jgi:hypothetical protein
MNKRWIGIICLVIFALISIVYSVYIEGKNKKYANLNESFQSNTERLPIKNEISDNLIKNGAFQNGKNIGGFIRKTGNAQIIPKQNPGDSSYVISLKKVSTNQATYSFKIDGLRTNTTYLIETYGRVIDKNGKVFNKKPIVLTRGGEQTYYTYLNEVKKLKDNYSVFRAFFETNDHTQISLIFSTNPMVNEIDVTNVSLKRLILDATDLPVTDGLKVYLNTKKSFNLNQPNILKDLSGTGNDFSINSSINNYSENYINIDKVSIFSDTSAHDIISKSKNKALIPFSIILNVQGQEGLLTTSQGTSIGVEKQNTITDEDGYASNIEIINKENIDRNHYKNVLNIPGNNGTSLILLLEQTYGNPIIKLADKYFKIKYNVFTQEDNYFSIILKPTQLKLNQGLQDINIGYEVSLYVNNIQIGTLPSQPLYFNDNPISINVDGNFNAKFSSLLMYDVTISPNQLSLLIDYLRRDKLNIAVPKNDSGLTSNNQGANNNLGGMDGTLGGMDGAQPSISTEEEESQSYDENCPEVYYKNGRYWIYMDPSSALAKKVGYCGERDYGRNRRNAKRIFETNFPNCKVPTILSGLNFEGDMSNCPFIIHQDNPCSYDECRNVDWSKSNLNLSRRCKMRVNHYCMLNNKLDPACICWRKENMNCAKCRNWRAQFEETTKCDLGRKDIAEHPDFDKYIKKDKIPCWNCNLNAPSYGNGDKCES